MSTAYRQGFLAYCSQHNINPGELEKRAGDETNTLSNKLNRFRTAVMYQDPDGNRVSGVAPKMRNAAAALREMVGIENVTPPGVKKRHPGQTSIRPGGRINPRQTLGEDWGKGLRFPPQKRPDIDPETLLKIKELLTGGRGA